jgi:hypothetical protein
MANIIDVNTVYIMLQYGYSVQKIHNKIKNYLTDNFCFINVGGTTYRLNFDDNTFEITYYTDKLKRLFDIDDNVKGVFVEIKRIYGNTHAIAFAKRICNYIENGIIIVPNASVDPNHNLFVVQQYGENYSTKVEAPISMKVLDAFGSENPSKYAILYDVKYDKNITYVDWYEKVTGACIKLKYDNDIDISQILKVGFDCKYYIIGAHRYEHYVAMLSVSKDTNTNTIYLQIDMYDDNDSLISIMTMDTVRIKIDGVKSEDVCVESISYRILGRDYDIVCEQTFDQTFEIVESFNNMKGE